MATDTKMNKLPVGRDLLVVLGIVVGLSLVVTGGTIFSYLAILAASGLRNQFFGGLGSGMLFYSIVGLFMLVEALILTGVYRLLRRALNNL